MTLAIGSVLLSMLNLASAALIAERRRCGWLVALAAQVPWVWYDVSTRQLGFLLLTLVYAPIYLRGWRHSRPWPAGAAPGPVTPRAATPAHLLDHDAVLHPALLARTCQPERAVVPSSCHARALGEDHLPAWV